MIQRLLTSLLTVRHDYRTPLNTMRAQIILPFSLGAGTLLLLLNGLMLFNVVVQRSSALETYVLVIFPISWITCFLSVYLIQRGQLHIGLLLLGAIIFGYNFSDVMLSGSMTTGIIFPMGIIYASLAFGRRGAILAYVYTIGLLIVMWIVRSDGLLGTEEIDDLSTIVFFSGVNLTVVGLMVWLFGGTLQTVLDQLNRVISQTRATATTGQTIARILNMDELLTEAVNVIRDRFAFFHVQIFIVDEARNYANLAAATGESGQTLLAQGFQVPIGPRTVVGDAISNRQMQYVPDITQTAYRHPDELADSRSILVIPLEVGEDVIGALDIQSTRANAFTAEDIETMTIMAHQVSQAINNAQLFEAQQRNLLQNRRLFLESETNLREIERLNRQLTGDSWQEYLNEYGYEQLGVKVVGDHVEQGQVEWTNAMQQAADRRRIVMQKDGPDQIVALPISIRGEPIGAIEVRLSGQHNQSEVRNLLQAVSERMAFSLENARLFAAAQLAAEREQQINQITARLQGLTNVEDVLTTAIAALGEVLAAEQGTIRLIGPDVLQSEDASVATSTNNGQDDKPLDYTRHTTKTNIRPIKRDHKD